MGFYYICRWLHTEARDREICYPYEKYLDALSKTGLDLYVEGPCDYECNSDCRATVSKTHESYRCICGCRPGDWVLAAVAGTPAAASAKASDAETQPSAASACTTAPGTANPQPSDPAHRSTPLEGRGTATFNYLFRIP